MKANLKKIALICAISIGALNLPVFAQQKPADKLEVSQDHKAKLNEKLNLLLANYSIFFQNARGLHWNIKGHHFFELHAKYEQVYSDALLKVDQIAERILTLGGIPVVTFDEYTKLSLIKPASGISDVALGVDLVCNSFKTLIALEKGIAKLATEFGDDVTANLMVEYIAEQQKEIWKFKAFSAPEKK